MSVTVAVCAAFAFGSPIFADLRKPVAGTGPAWLGGAVFVPSD